MSKKASTFEPVAETVDEPILDEILDEVEEIEEVAPEAEAVVAAPEIHVAVDGDSYASIAALYKPAGMTKHEYAKQLLERNSGKKISAETVIHL